MKVVVSAFSARDGGGQTYLRNLLALVPTDGSVECVVYAPKTLPLASHPYVKVAPEAWPSYNLIFRAIWEALVLPRILKRWHADILFCPGGVVLTKAVHGCRVVTMFRNMIPFDPVVIRKLPYAWQRIRNKLLRRKMLQSMRDADLTIFVSEYARELVRELVPIKRSVTIPHGVAPNFREQSGSLERNSYNVDRPYLLYVSRFDVYKHHEEVIRAYALLPRELREKYALVLVGEKRPNFIQKLERIIVKYSVSDDVVIGGEVSYDKLPPVYWGATAVIFASSCENCPNILLEAMASGRPVVCSSVMPMPEFGGADLLYFDPTKPSELVEALITVLTKPLQNEAVARAALRRSWSYDWRKTATRTWSELRDLASKTVS